MADAKNKPLAGLDFSCLLNVDAASLIQLIARLVGDQGPAIAPTAADTRRVQLADGASSTSSASSSCPPPPSQRGCRGRGGRGAGRGAGAAAVAASSDPGLPGDVARCRHGLDGVGVVRLPAMNPQMTVPCRLQASLWA
jgi:hypothetical protein